MSHFIAQTLSVLRVFKKQDTAIGQSFPRIGIIQGVFLAGLFFLLLMLCSPERDFAFLLVAYAIFPFFSLLFFGRAWLTLLFLIPFLDLAPSIFGMTKLPVSRVFLIALTLCFFLFYKKGWDFWRRLLGSPVFIGWSLFVFANLISAIHALNVEAFFRALTYLEPLLFYMLTYYVVSHNLNYMKSILSTILAGGIIVGAIGLAEMLFQNHVRSLFDIPQTEAWSRLLAENRFGLGGRIASTISHPVYAGLYFLIILLLFVLFIYVYKPRLKSLLFLLIPLYILLILGTGSRAVLLCLVISILSFVVFSKEKKKIIIPVLLAFLILLLAIFLVFPQIPRYFQKSTTLKPADVESHNIRLRIQMAEVFLNVFKENKLFGHGPGLIQKESLERTSIQFEGFHGIENQYLIILADGGILAGLAYLLFMAGILFQSLKMSRSQLSKEVQAGGIGLLVLLTAYFAFVVSETCLTFSPYLLLMALYGGVVAQHDQEALKFRSSNTDQSSASR